MKKSEALKILTRLVSLPSFIGKENPSFETQASNYLKTYFKENHPDFRLKSIKVEGKRENLLFQNSNSVKVLFACHMDTVPPSSKDALDPKVRGDKVYGLGTKDMKGGIAATLLALKDMTAKGVGVLFYIDEETSFKGIVSAAEKSRSLFSTPPELIVSPESRFNLGIGARGIVSLGVKVKGKKAHSARPHLGVDAVRGFFRVIETVEKGLNTPKSALGLTTINVARVQGGNVDDNGNIGFHIGTVPDYLEAEVSVRNAKVGLDARGVVQLLSQEAKKHGLGLTATIKEDYAARSTAPSIVKKVVHSIKSAIGKEVEIADPKLSGFNDVTILSRKIGSALVNFGPYGEGNHTKEEWVSVKSILETAKVFKEIIKDFC